MHELTEYEVKQISGGFGPAGAALGAFTGAVGYLGHAATSGNFNTYKFAIATGTGAATGLAGGLPATAAARYLIPRITAGGGAAQGAF